MEVIDFTKKEGEEKKGVDTKELLKTIEGISKEVEGKEHAKVVIGFYDGFDTFGTFWFNASHLEVLGVLEKLKHTLIHGD